MTARRKTGEGKEIRGAEGYKDPLPPAGGTPECRGLIFAAHNGRKCADEVFQRAFRDKKAAVSKGKQQKNRRASPGGLMKYLVIWFLWAGFSAAASTEKMEGLKACPHCGFNLQENVSGAAEGAAFTPENSGNAEEEDFIEINAKRLAMIVSGGGLIATSGFVFGGMGVAVSSALFAVGLAGSLCRDVFKTKVHY